MSIQIQEYTEDYKEQIIELFKNFQDYLIELDPLKRLRRLPEYAENVHRETLEVVKQKNGIFYVAVEDDRVIGFIVGVLEEQSKMSLLGATPAIMGRITELYIDERYRKQGVGSQLMQAVERYFTEKQCEYIWVEVFVPNRIAHEFYKKFGYCDRDIDMIKKL
jgi:ribosomal protein S18 acetylase RimI-like enzyme